MIRCHQLLIIFFWILQVNQRPCNFNASFFHSYTNCSGLKTVSWFFNFSKINRKVMSAVIRVDSLLHNTSTPNLKGCKLSILSFDWILRDWSTSSRFIGFACRSPSCCGIPQAVKWCGIAGSHFAGLSSLAADCKFLLQSFQDTIFKWYLSLKSPI